MADPLEGEDRDEELVLKASACPGAQYEHCVLLCRDVLSAWLAGVLLLHQAE
jgi:hypothetical protein